MSGRPSFTVGALRRALEGFSDDMPVVSSFTFDSGDENRVGGIVSVEASYGCTETLALVIESDEEADRLESVRVLSTTGENV